MWFSENFSDKFSGDSCEGPPVPISNTVVKLANAESTCLETSREDRKSLITQKSSPTGGFFYLHLYVETNLPARLVDHKNLAE